MTEKTRPPKLVRDLMTVGVLTCSPETPITELARAMLKKNLEAVIIQDQEGHAVGVVSEDELVNTYGYLDFVKFSAEEIMNPVILELPPDIPLKAAAQIMLDQKVRTAFMMHHASGKQYPAAYLSFRNLLRYIAMEEENEIEDLGIRASRKLPLKAFVERRDKARKKNLSQHKTGDKHDS